MTFVTFSSSSSSYAQSKVKQYPKGAEVDIYYDPANHTNAVIEKGVQSSIYILPGIGLLFAIIGIGMVIFEMRN